MGRIKGLTRAQVVWGGLFILSVAIFILYVMDWFTRADALAISAPRVVVIELSVVLSVITVIITLIGFISSTALNWRRDAREARQAKLEVEEMRLELEKLRLEIEKLDHEVQKQKVGDDMASKDQKENIS